MLLDNVKLRKLRTERRLSQADLADKIGVSQTTIWEWEQRDSNVKLELFLKLGEELQCDPNDLAKDGMSIQINTQHNNTNTISENSIIGVQVNIEAFEMMKQLIATQKELITLLMESLSKNK